MKRRVEPSRRAIRDAIAAAASAGHFNFAVKLAKRHRLAPICIACARRAPLLKYQADSDSERAPMCGACYTQWHPDRFVLRARGRATANVFTDWTKLLRALHRSKLAHREIVFDDSLGPCVIPEGRWRLPKCELVMHGIRPVPPTFDPSLDGTRHLTRVVVPEDAFTTHHVDPTASLLIVGLWLTPSLDNFRRTKAKR